MRDKRKQEENDGDLDDIPLFLSIMYNTMFHASYQGLSTLATGLERDLYH